MPIARERLSTAMLDYGECPEAIIFQLEDPVETIEWRTERPASGAALAGME